MGVVTVGNFQIGVIHGHSVVPWGDHEALAAVQRRLDVDILVFGHTHEYEAFEYEGKLFVNPGSITGAYSPVTDDVTPSFVLMKVSGSTITCYIYHIVDDKVTIEKVVHRKGGGEDDDEDEYEEEYEEDDEDDDEDVDDEDDEGEEDD